MLRLPLGDRPDTLGEDEISEGIEEDLERLERVSRRFELIGRDVELKEVDLVELIQELERYLRARMPRLGSGVSLDVEMQPDLPKVWGSDVLLAWALENLVKNALDALAGTGGAIRIRMEAEGSGDPGSGGEGVKWVVVSVMDSGPGVLPEIRERIFEPGVSSKPRGWGVGLALTLRIVERIHKGRISLAKTGPSGTVFRMKLPVVEG